MQTKQYFSPLCQGSYTMPFSCCVHRAWRQTPRLFVCCACPTMSFWYHYFCLLHPMRNTKLCNISVVASIAQDVKPSLAFCILTLLIFSFPSRHCHNCNFYCSSLQGFARMICHCLVACLHLLLLLWQSVAVLQHVCVCLFAVTILRCLATHLHVPLLLRQTVAVKLRTCATTILMTAVTILLHVPQASLCAVNCVSSIIGPLGAQLFCRAVKCVPSFITLWCSISLLPR